MVLNQRIGIHPLIQPLFDGPLDIIGDVHGEIDALLTLMHRLGYDGRGLNPTRRLVFLGDLTDRGPDSPSVVKLVQSLVAAGRAQCILGNHDLNILLGEEKHDNDWFFGRAFRENGVVVPQVLADATTRDMVTGFFRTLPLALERPDLRVVHACWQPEMIDIARAAKDAEELYKHHQQLIEADFAARPYLDEIEQDLEHQNLNPVKVLTSGLEARVETPFEASGKLRYQGRVNWWESYELPELCVFGHYAIPFGQPRGHGQAVCVDFGIGKRWTERPLSGPKFNFKLAALRIPENELVFDDGTPSVCIS
jgi:hypothetical protein